ncbi:MAG TPA: DNA polymerase IV [Pseudolysinimonas sp.]|nr:DNA polymerase IV [Pseudolysinimonas sp.]
MSKQDGSSRQITADPSDDISAHVMHLDMDAFFASVELLEHPELAGQPVIVGHRSPRSVVTAATYEARKYGVNSAMPMAQALRRCPHAVVLEPHFERYTHYSRRVMQLIGDVTPQVEPLSIDEAFFDVAGARRLLGTPWQIGTALRERVFRETGLHASIGAAASKFVAKLASSRAKPDGLLVVPEADTLAFLHPLPLSTLWGVGAKAEEQLTRLGLRTVRDVADVPLDTLSRAVGVAQATRLHELSWGRDVRGIELERTEKSMGHETTFDSDVVDSAVIYRALLGLADGVAVRLRQASVQARTVSIKLRFEDFTTITRSRTLAEPTNLARRIYEESRSLYDAASQNGRAVRLIGVRGEQLVAATAAQGLWDDDEAWRDAEHTVDAVSSRFGVGSVTPAALLGGGQRRRFGHGDD